MVGRLASLWAGLFFFRGYVILLGKVYRYSLKRFMLKIGEVESSKRKGGDLDLYPQFAGFPHL